MQSINTRLDWFVKFEALRDVGELAGETTVYPFTRSQHTAMETNVENAIYLNLRLTVITRMMLASIDFDSFLSVLQPSSESYLKKSSMAANLISKTVSRNTTLVQSNVLLTRTIHHRKYSLRRDSRHSVLEGFPWLLEIHASNTNFACTPTRFNERQTLYIISAGVGLNGHCRRIWLLLERDNYWFDDQFKTREIL